MGVGILVLDHAAGTLTHDCASGYEYSTVALIAPRFGARPHQRSGLVPLWIGMLWICQCLPRGYAGANQACDRLSNDAASVSNHHDVRGGRLCDA